MIGTVCKLRRCFLIFNNELSRLYGENFSKFHSSATTVSVVTLRMTTDDGLTEATANMYFSHFAILSL